MAWCGTPLQLTSMAPLSGTPTESLSSDRIWDTKFRHLMKEMTKFRHLMKEMTEKWEDLLLDLEKDKGFDNNNNQKASLGDCGEDSLETVMVEKARNSWIFHLKCPCGRGYQILLSKMNCYYKRIADPKDNSQEDCVQVVTVEKAGETVTIYLECPGPCGRAYQILSFRGHCYYGLPD